MIEEHLKVEQPCSAYDLLRKSTDIAGETLKQAARFGCIWLETNSKPKRLRRLKQMLNTGDMVHLYLNKTLLNASTPEAECVADLTDYSIWFKPRGMFSQGSKWGDAHSIARHVELTLERPSYLVHRLDRMTAGLIIIAHRKKLVQKFTHIFSQREIEKIYYAVVCGKPDNEHFTMTQALDDRRADTEAWLINYEEGTNQSIIKVLLKTGRKHQIRRHLALAGLPLLGDRQYGEKQYGNDNTDVDLQLLAAQLEFVCPINGGTVTYELSEDFVAKELIMSPSKLGS